MFVNTYELPEVAMPLVGSAVHEAGDTALEVSTKKPGADSGHERLTWFAKA